jgi:hypothetical protein
MTKDQTAAHFEASIAAAANARALTPKIIQAAQRELALCAAARSVKKWNYPQHLRISISAPVASLTCSFVSGSLGDNGLTG